MAVLRSGRAPGPPLRLPRNKHPMLQLVWFDQQLRTKKYPTARQFAEHFGLSGLEGVKRWVLSCGGQAEVLAPESLRKAVAAEVRRLAAVYRAG